MSCGNCGTSFNPVSKIKSTWIPNKDQNEEAEYINISEALSIIFEKSPLKHSSTTDLNFEDSIFSKSIKENNDNQNGLSGKRFCSPLDLCSKCAETLTILYNSFQEFTQICKLECEIAKKLQELDKLRDRDVDNPITLTNVRRESRKRKTVPSADKKRLAIAARTSRKVSKTQVKTKRFVGRQLVQIKQEYDSDLDFQEGLSELENQFYFQGKRGPDCSPDSPVNFECPRSTRPVRKTSTRNKNLSELFEEDKNEDDNRRNCYKVAAAEILNNNVKVDLNEGEISDAGIAEDETNDEDNEEDEEYLPVPGEDFEEMPSSNNEKRKRSSHSVPLRIRAPKPKNFYKCSVKDCTTECFKRKFELVQHLSTFHAIQPSEEDLPLLTRTPGQIGRAKSLLEMEVQCLHCDKVVKRKRLKPHMLMHTEEKSHMCHLCGMKFSRRSNLSSHIQDVHYGEKTHICSICKQGFKRPHHLKDHEKLHTDDKPFSCDICSKNFRFEKNMKKHMVCHTESKNFVCETCGKSFGRIDNMRAHVKMVHEGMRPKKNPRKIRSDRRKIPKSVAAV